MPHTYVHPRAALSVDCVVFGLDDESLKVLLIQRSSAPFAGRWALPGGFVRMRETLEEAARRELAEETGVTLAYLEQLYTFGEPDRDPRERVVTVAYFALVKRLDYALRAATDASAAAWFAVDQLPELAFDHAEIFAVARERLRSKVSYEPLGFELLPIKFTLSQLQRLYEVVLERALDKRNFRKKILALEILQELDELEQDVAHRAARLYKFDPRKYQRLKKRGFQLEI
jgi:8-oxo-dGTP diphosphatase